MNYRVIRTVRRTVAIQIAPDGEVVVRCPVYMSDGAVDSFVQSKQGWINKQLVKIPVVQALTFQELRELACRAKIEFVERTAYFASLLDVKYGRITIRAQHTRWGSCSAAGNLSFNCLLMLAPPWVREYVIVHELCHLKQMNHTPLFWSEVEKVLPDYRTVRKWLKDNGNYLLGHLPKNLE